MQLNESTYETIFLLYIDNELSPKERLEVDAFIADNPSYALEMEALQATMLSPDKIHYPFKENLKQQSEISLEALEEEWDQTYAIILKANMQAMPGLTTDFKNGLKKETTKEGIVVKSFGFSQQKFTYAAIAACLMVFFGYQQLTKTPASNSIVANTKNELLPSAASSLVENEISNASQKVFEERIETIAATKQVLTKPRAITKLQASNPIKTQPINIIEQESIVMVELANKNGSLNKQTLLVEIPRTYNNPITIDAIAIAKNSIDTEKEIEENGSVSYEIIDTEDPNRTVFIANFEIDGNRFRGLKRKVNSLFKNNKSERNK
jgi:hypothetical protein